MSAKPRSAASQQRLMQTANAENAAMYGGVVNPGFVREPSNVSASHVQLEKLLANDEEVGEQTIMHVVIENEELSRKARRTELGSKKKLLTRRWQTTLAVGLVLVALAAGIGGLAYWISIPKVITQPYLLYGQSCYINSRSCDATRLLWCPAGTCVCTGNYLWNATALNCSCGQYQMWTGFTCTNYGYYGDPCLVVPCQPTLTCSTVVNQTITTSQKICMCDNSTYLSTISPNNGKCVAKLTYTNPCLTNSDCSDWLGLACTNVAGSKLCECTSTAYWNGSICVQNALGWQPCSASVPCDTTRGLTCTSGTCQCDQYSYYDNITTLWCQTKKTYAVSCAFTFQCNTTIGLSCPTASTGCNCPSTSQALICDCSSGFFWDGQRCSATHAFNGTCPGQYACVTTGNLVCYLGHCICPGNELWNNMTANACACPFNTTLQSNNICSYVRKQVTRCITCRKMSSQPRHVYTPEQRAILESSFARQSHPDIVEKEHLARLLNCNLIQISNWFQNHRRRVKKANESHPIKVPSDQVMPVHHESNCSYASYYYQPPPPQYVCMPPSHPQQLFYTPMCDPYLTTYEQ